MRKWSLFRHTFSQECAKCAKRLKDTSLANDYWHFAQNGQKL